MLSQTGSFFMGHPVQEGLTSPKVIMISSLMNYAMSLMCLSHLPSLSVELKILSPVYSFYPSKLELIMCQLSFDVQDKVGSFLWGLAGEKNRRRESS